MVFGTASQNQVALQFTCQENMCLYLIRQLLDVLTPETQLAMSSLAQEMEAQCLQDTRPVFGCSWYGCISP